MPDKPVLVTGATGYVGGRLVIRLLNAGYRVRAMGRSMEKLQGRTWAGHPDLELFQADGLDTLSLSNAVKGCFAAYYLIHSMTHEHVDFSKIDKEIASNFVKACRGSGLKRVIYLGGLGDYSLDLSHHLKSRIEVGSILKSGSISTTILCSAHILGSGSASYEILRYLAERLPIMIIPNKIINTKIQPICIRNVLNYLVGCLEKPETQGETFDIGGPDIISYRQLIEIYSEVANIRKPIFISSPVFKFGRKFGFFVAKRVMPVPAGISEPLLEGAANEAIVRDSRIFDIIPQNLMGCRETLQRANQKDSLQIVETRWTDAGKMKPPEWVHSGDAPYAGGTLLQGGFKVALAAAPEDIWPLISRIGGQNGWYFGNFLWQIRGWMDSLAGGVGLRRGRRHIENLQTGDALDFWRVLEVDPPNRLILVAEMKLPGEAIMDFEIAHIENGVTELRLGTRFRPRGIYGMLYWYALLPFHDLLFGNMLKKIAIKVKRPILKEPSKFKPGPIIMA